MKNWKELITKTSIATTILTVCLSSIAAPAKAGWGLSDLDPTNKNSGIRKVGRDIDPTNPNGRLGRDIHAKFNICNKTKQTIYYSVNNRQDSLKKGYCVDWTTTGQAVINFDRGFVNGYQDQTYTLNDGKYAFVETTWKKAGRGVDLRRN